MKKLFIISMVFNVMHASDDTLLSKTKKFSLALSALQQFKDLEELQADLQAHPSPGRRQRSREVALLSQEVLKCHNADHFQELCCEVKKIYEKYRAYMDRKDFVETDGPAQTGREVLNSSLLSLLREIGKTKGLISAEYDDLIKEDESFATPTMSRSTCEDNRVKRLQRADLSDPFKRYGSRLQVSMSQDPLDGMHISWSQVFSDISDSE